jgi:hypothetical protein
MAMQGKINSNANQLRSSNFEQLESYIQDTLDSGESLRLKLESPLSVGAVLTKYVKGGRDIPRIYWLAIGLAPVRYSLQIQRLLIGLAPFVKPM